MLNEDKKISLFEVVLFILIVLGEMSKVHVFSGSVLFGQIVNWVQLPIYLLLVLLAVQKNYSLKEKKYIVIIGAFLLFGYIQSKQAAFFRAFLLILAAKDISFKNLLRTYRYAISGTLIFTVILYLFRISDSGLSIKGKTAFGYVHPNISAQIIMILVLLWLTEKGNETKVRDYVLCEFIALILFLLTGSKTSFIIIAIAPIVFEFCKSRIQVVQNNKFVNLTAILSHSLMLIFTWCTAKALPYITLLKKLDLFVTNRIFLNYYLFNKFSLKLFGQNISLRESEPVYNNIQQVGGAIITCDNSYVVSLLCMGLIPTIIFTLAYMCIIKKAIKYKNGGVIAAAVLLAIYAFCESQMIEIYSNFVYIYIFAKPTIMQKEEGKKYDT